MKIEMEPREIKLRGVSIISENAEEMQVLENIWNQRGSPVILSSMQDGNVQLVIAPTPEEENGHAH